MTSNGVSAGLLDVGGEESGGILKPEFRARVCNPEHSEDGYDRNDRYGDDHLHSREPVLYVAVHLRHLPPDRHSSSVPTGATTVPPKFVRVFGVLV